MAIKVGVIGLGYWGPNYIRNFIRHEHTEVLWGCDVSEEASKKIHKIYPQVKLTRSLSNLLNDKSLDLIAIATPPETHYEIIRSALNAGKHVLVAKPLATKSSQARELLKSAEKKGLMLHGDLTYLYTGAVRAIKNLLTKQVIGKPLYYDSIRTNLGLIQKDVNVIWDLAPHDFSIIGFLFGFRPIKISAVGSKHYANSKGEEMAHITINYTNNFISHIHISWLSPVKLRTTLIGGTEKMIFFDDVQPDEKVKIYDKGVSISAESVTPFKPVYRSGDVIIPKLDQEEALYLEVEDIVNQVEGARISYANAQLNLDIIELLEACDQSLKENKPVTFGP